jgi:hypothetical protein
LRLLGRWGFCMYSTPGSACMVFVKFGFWFFGEKGQNEGENAAICHCFGCGSDDWLV